MKKFIFTPSVKPPAHKIGLMLWIRENLFPGPFSGFLSVVALLFLVWIAFNIVDWAVINAVFIGNSKEVCDATSGACWIFIKNRFSQLMTGLYFASHPEEMWRPIISLLLLVVFGSLFFIKKFKYKIKLGFFMILIFPFIIFAILHGKWLGLPVADSSQWGGFLLTIILAIVGAVVALPLGILLALGRTSNLPVIKKFCVIFIEFWRGSPLILILFMASILLPLFLPSNVDLNKVLRALVGISLFQSAYVAEAIRGGLNSIDKGQFEGADSIGLNYFYKNVFVILPQALKVSIPSIVNSFIGLFKDTSLVSIIGLSDFVNIARFVSRSVEWRGYDAEAYVFVALVFGFCCYAMSKYSQHLERRFNTDNRK